MRRALPLLLSLSACAMPDAPGVRIIGHGGLGEGANEPMNSAASLLGALALGLDGVELDAQLTADGVLVAYHAQDLSELTSCKGLVNAVAWDALRECPVSGRDGRPHPIERLDSLLTHAARSHPGADFTLDCKLFAAGDWWPYLEGFSDALTALDGLPGMSGRLLVECQTMDLLRLVRRKRPDIPVHLYATDFDTGLATANANGFNGITMHNARTTAEQVATARSWGLSVTLFGVGGGMGHRNALAKQPDRLQTDSPEAFAR